MLALQIHELDNVATALRPLPKGATVCGVCLLEPVPTGHKFALQPIACGAPILKYGAHIGVASKDIAAGAWVHVHNLEGERGRGDVGRQVRRNLQTGSSQEPALPAELGAPILSGFRRADGSFGFRNHILLVPSVYCVNRIVERIAAAFAPAAEQTTAAADVVYVTHQSGCGELGADACQARDILLGTGANPNVFGVVVVGLGCESLSAARLAAGIKQRVPYKEVFYLNVQDTGVAASVAKGKKLVAGLLQQAQAQLLSRGSLADVVLGTECGGSDSFSGLSANPALGLVADQVIRQGGKVVLAETPELIGAEHLLAARASSEAVARQVVATITGFEQMVLQAKLDIRGTNPSPGNIAGGLSSIEEKSLGCIHKAGTQPVEAVIAYGQPVTARGLTFMDTPGNDVEQLSAMVAGGCNVCIFTTGRGTPVGSALAPTLKVASNNEVVERMPDVIDVNGGTILTGAQSLQQVAATLLQWLEALGRGRLTKAELNEQNDFAIWRRQTTV